jgi:hypothetical protein
MKTILAKATKAKTATINDAIDLYTGLRRDQECSGNGQKPRTLKKIQQRLGNRVIAQLTPKEIWDATADMTWPTQRTVLELLKGVLNNAKKPKSNIFFGGRKFGTPAPLITWEENPLENIQINVKNESGVGWRLSGPTEKMLKQFGVK